MARQIQRWSMMKDDNDVVCITMDDSGPLVLWKDVAPMLEEAPPSAAPNKPMPKPCADCMHSKNGDEVPYGGTCFDCCRKCWSSFEGRTASA